MTFVTGTGCRHWEKPGNDNRGKHVAAPGSSARYNTPMDRILDKLIVFVCCLPMLLTAPVDAALVAAFLIGMSATLFDETVLRRQADSEPSALQAPSNRAFFIIDVAASCAYLVAACFVPVFLLFAALPLYSVAYRRTTMPCAALMLIALACAPGLGLSAVSIGLAASAGTVAFLLAARASRAESRRIRNREERDRLRGQSLKLEERNRDLLARQEYEAQLATMTERSRIAREIHDNVGHLLTRAIMQVEALRVVHGQEPAVKKDFEAVGATLNEALSTMRTSVHGLADEACDLSVQIRQTVDAACRDTGLEATCLISAGEATPQVTSCLTAVVREALSNTLRHADQATGVKVELVEHPGFWRMTITDNGQRPKAATNGEGFGLVSMEQRVRALGGTMNAAYSDRAHGFVVFVSIPKKEQAA
ncbi:MAG: sensor histidine kinase [Eggerthellaceae bacterium]|jgi:signal transduction histidine kinase